VRIFSWEQGDEGVRGEWGEVLEGRGGAGFGRGLWECEGFLRAGRAE